MNIRERVLDFLREEKLTDAPSYLVAVSGGVDSVVLLHVLVELREKLNLELGVAHLDHGLRGDNSCQDRIFVERKADKLGLNCFTDKLDNLRQQANQEGSSEEEMARKKRYQFLRRVAEQRDFEYVALGHNRDDRAETLLINLIRGAGVRGLRGMKPIRPPFIRPLIDCSRDEILDYATTRGLDYRLDATNLDTKYLRNRIRHELLPRLEDDYNPRIKATLARTSKIMNEADSFLKDHFQQRWEALSTSREDGSLVIDVDNLTVFHRFVSKRLVRRAIAEIKGDLHDVSYRHISQAVENLYSNTSRWEIHLPDQVVLRQDGNCLHVSQLPFQKGGSEDYYYTAHVGEEIVLPKPGYKFRAEVHSGGDLSPSDVVSCDPLEEYIDARMVQGQLTIRNRSDGDRFQPLGMKGHKKLKDFFIDQKVPYNERDMVPLLADEEAIIWVIGFRINHNYRVQDDTERILKLQVETL
ncbi:MAG: tRNA lysidine(34) synthetase TilS [Candidatus Bipolaricaulota bacterium]